MELASRHQTFSFKPSKRLPRGPIVTGRTEAEVGHESEGGDVEFGVGDSDKSTAITVRNDKGGRYFARGAVERSTRARYSKSFAAGSEAMDSTREDIDVQNSELGGEEIMFTMSEMKGFTQALSGAVQI